MSRGRTGPINVALAGAGMISWHHLTAWRKLGERVRLVAICEPDPERGANRAREFGIGRVCRTPEDLFDGTRIDALDIAAPRETHAAWIEAAAAHGVDVLCQKPLAPTFAEAAAVLGRAGSIRVMAHDNWRFRPWYRDAGAMVAGGEVGDLLQASLRMFSSELLADASGRRPGLERQPFMAAEARLMIAEVLIHHLDVLRFLCGPLRIVHARTLRTVADVVGETAATIVLETEQGRPVLLSGTMTAPGFPARSKDRLELIGTKASIVLDAEELRLLGPSPRTITYEFEEAYQASFDNAVSHFVGCLETGAPFETDAATDNLQTLELVESAYSRASAAQSAGGEVR
jgi:predicted dehydrogenase